MHFQKEGFVELDYPFSFSDTDEPRLPPQNLIQIPASPGLFFQTDGTYLALSDASLKRKSIKRDNSTERTYCLQAESRTPTKVQAGAVEIFEYKSTGWRLFRLDANRCAYSDTRKSSGRWVVGYRDKPALQVEAVGDAFSIHTAALEAGHYFVANWEGFFVPAESSNDLYRGHWFQVLEG